MELPINMNISVVPREMVVEVDTFFCEETDIVDKDAGAH